MSPVLEMVMVYSSVSPGVGTILPSASTTRASVFVAEIIAAKKAALLALSEAIDPRAEGGVLMIRWSGVAALICVV
jgi:hypothetical protein